MNGYPWIEFVFHICYTINHILDYYTSLQKETRNKQSRRTNDLQEVNDRTCQFYRGHIQNLLVYMKFYL